MNCQTFTNQLGEIKAQLQPLVGLIEAFKANPTPENEDAFQKALEDVQKRKDAFVEDYQKGVRDMLSQWNWIRYDLDRRALAEMAEFEDSGRVVLNRSLNLTSPETTYFPSIIRVVKGNLTFAYGGKYVKSLDGLEEVDGSLGAEGTLIESAKNLRRVGGLANFRKSAIKNLDALEEAGSLYVEDCNELESIDSIKRVGGTFSLGGTKVKKLDSLIRIDKLLSLATPQLESMQSLEYIGSRLALSDTSALHIARNFYKIFPKLKYIGNYPHPIDRTAIWVGTKEEKEIFERIKEEGRIQIDGEIYADADAVNPA